MVISYTGLITYIGVLGYNPLVGSWQIKMRKRSTPDSCGQHDVDL